MWAAYYPWARTRYMLMANGCMENGSTFIHEFGHYFGLLHTHGTNGNRLTDELVDGSNCEISGDSICDTPADPNLGNYNTLHYDCVYRGLERDANGTLFQPQTRNFMSYAPKMCRDLFTPQQLDRMAFFRDFQDLGIPRLVCEDLGNLTVDGNNLEVDGLVISNQGGNYLGDFFHWVLSVFGSGNI